MQEVQRKIQSRRSDRVEQRRRPAAHHLPQPENRQTTNNFSKPAPPAAEKQPAAIQTYLAAVNKIKSDPSHSLWLREAARILDMSTAADAIRDVQALLKLQQMR